MDFDSRERVSRLVDCCFVSVRLSRFPIVHCLLYSPESREMSFSRPARPSLSSLTIASHFILIYPYIDYSLSSCSSLHPSLSLLAQSSHTLQLLQHVDQILSSCAALLAVRSSFHRSDTPTCSLIDCDDESDTSSAIDFIQVIPSFLPSGVLHLVYGNVDVGGGKSITISITFFFSAAVADLDYLTNSHLNNIAQLNNWHLSVSLLHPSSPLLPVQGQAQDPRIYSS